MGFLVNEERGLHKMRNDEISVCMATYNGEKFLKEQIDSILVQLQSNDELVIVDDCSTDSTKSIIESYSDKRIKVFYNEHNVGVNRNFEKAITYSKNKYIFLADQDDIWVPKRANNMYLELLKSKVFVVTGNMIFVDENGEKQVSTLKRINDADSMKKYKNIGQIFSGKSAYFGCAMAFSRDLCGIILPFPSYIESHDIWIAMAGILLNGNHHYSSDVLFRRIHKNNVSLVHRKLHKMIYSRIIFIRQMIELRSRYKHIGGKYD